VRTEYSVSQSTLDVLASWQLHDAVQGCIRSRDELAETVGILNQLVLEAGVVRISIRQLSDSIGRPSNASREDLKIELLTTGNARRLEGFADTRHQSRHRRIPGCQFLGD
jgi:hypothetical protein